MAKQSLRVVVLGASAKPERYAHRAQQMLMDHGYQVVLVSRRAETILGISTLQSLREVTPPVDVITVYVGAAQSSGLLEDMLALKPRRVIFNPGAENALLEAALQKAGIEVWRACTLVLLRTNQFALDAG
ncbi:MAG: CoA-binding protein [Gammaproteobacteria bacterium]|nr:CoA-binding protein [Gammaproteobacteria bacterium]